MAAFVARKHGFRAALVFVALPILLLVPSHYSWDLPGLPDATFWNYAFLVTLAALWFGTDRPLVRFHPLDLLVLAFGVAVVATEFANKDLAEARNAGARYLMGAVAPYLFGRAAAQRDGLAVGVLAMLVALGAVIGLVAPYEARMGTSPFDWPRTIWPGGSEFARSLYRNGMRRAEGPFAQPICQGLYYAMLVPPLLWLRDVRIERRRWVTLAVVAGFGLGLFLSQSRGPMLGAVLVAVLTLAAWSRLRGPILAAVLVGGAVAFVASFDTIRSHWFITRAEAVTEEQHSAAYRWEMLENYMELVNERPWGGFGRNLVPVVKGQDSIDNQYLFLALTHGLPAAFLYLAALLAPAFALFARLPRYAHDHRTARLGWAVAMSLVGVAVVQVSVYAGTQTEQVMFLFEGLAAGLFVRLRPVSPRASRTVAA